MASRRRLMPRMILRDGSSTSSAPPQDERLRAAVIRTRSEEHTSELQSLMRISYAVFCLKKKKKTKTKQKIIVPCKEQLTTEPSETSPTFTLIQDQMPNISYVNTA